MIEQDDVLLLQDDLDTDLSLNDNSGYDIHQLFDDDQICTNSGKKDDSRKTVPVLINLILGQLITVGVSLKVLLSLVKNLIKGKVLSLTFLTSQLKWLNFKHTRTNFSVKITNGHFIYGSKY